MGMSEKCDHKNVVCDPYCTDCSTILDVNVGLLIKKVAQLENALSNLMKDYARRVRMGAMLKPYLQARRLMSDDK